MVTVGRRADDLMHRFGAPWEGADRVELRALVEDGRCAAETLRRPGAPFPSLVPGEVEGLFEPALRVEALEAQTRSRHIATYLLDRLETTHA
jgi:hypothetical protein